MAPRRGIACLLVILLSGCAMVVPDWSSRRKMGRPTPPEVLVRVTPFGPVCATAKMDGQPYRLVVVMVDRRGGLEPAPCSIRINGSHGTAFPFGTTFRLDYRAGLGRHLIVIRTGDFETTRFVTVLECGE